MNEPSPTLLIIYLCPDYDEEARCHIDEMLTTAGIAYRLIAERVERVFLENAAPFVFKHIEKQLAFALYAPPDPKAIDAIAQLVMTGLIFGFVVKGEISLGGQAEMINNLGG